jgi:hypothetical protein
LCRCGFVAGGTKRTAGHTNDCFWSPIPICSCWLIQHSKEFDTSYPEIAVEYYSVHPREDDTLQVNSLVRLTDALLRRGYSNEDVRKIIGGNVLRHFREVWKG